MNLNQRVSASDMVRAAAALAFSIAVGSAALARAAQSDPLVSGTYRGVSSAVQFDVSPPLRELAPRQPAEIAGVEYERFDDPPSRLEGRPGPQDLDSVVQRDVGIAAREIPVPSSSFDGMQSSGSLPPDPNGAVGLSHYGQMVNTRYAVYSKTGTLLAGPSNINTLWSGFGGPCQNENAGDPIVLYDRIADRWLLTQFTSAGPDYFNCVALSTGPDPTGTYYRWAFGTGANFPDYPKYGIWPDAYYISTREFLPTDAYAGVGAYALNRAQMLAGNPSPQVISFLAPPGSAPNRIGDGLLPSDLDGTTLPPPGTPNFYIGSQDNGGPYGAPSDALNIWKFSVNFAAPGSSSFTLASTVAAAPFDSMFPCTGDKGRDCISQPDTTQKLDHQGYRQRLLHRAAYRNFGTHQSIVTNQSVEAANTTSGIRWYEIRSPNASPTIYQQGTYAPADGVHRWMGSIAQDSAGNMGLGYSASGTSTYPSVRYTGRLASDPLGTMPQGEGVFVAGGGSQTSTTARWGDYSAMTVDPADDCTFWYTNEYYAVTSSSGWRTRIGSFRFPSCGSGGTPPSAPTIGTATAGNAQATVTFTPPANNGGSTITGYTVTSNPGGITRTGTASPITVTGLTNGTSYTFTVTATNASGTGPSSAPSNSVTPTPISVTAGTLTTTFAGNFAQSGNMFDVQALTRSITINRFDLNLYATAGTVVQVNVYYKAGGYSGYQATPSAWTLLGIYSVVSAGPGNPSSMPVANLLLTAGQTYGIYLTTADGSDVVYTSGASTYANADIRVTLGIAVAYPFGTVFSPRTWNGTIYYSSVNADCVFNWAEKYFPNFFAPAGTISYTSGAIYFRYYTQTYAYLAAFEEHLYYLGPSSNNSVVDLGALSGWLSTAGCQ